MINYSILIDCPDEYLDILNIFFIYIGKNWKSRAATIYVTTQEAEITHPDNVRFIKCGTKKNSIERSLVALGYIQDDYFLTLGCDNYPILPVNELYIESLLSFMAKEGIRYTQIWKMHNKEHRKYKTSYQGLYFCNKKARYSRSLMANIWKREEYLKVFSNTDKNGWDIEGMWLKECFESKPGFFDDYCYYDLDPIHILHAVSKGCWIRSAYRKMKKNGISTELLNNRKKLSFTQSLKYELSMFLFNHLSSKAFFQLKRLTNKKKTYTTNY